MKVAFGDSKFKTRTRSDICVFAAVTWVCFFVSNFLAQLFQHGILDS